MKKEILTHKEIIEQTAIDPDILQQIISQKLIKSLSTVDENVFIFEKQTVQQINPIQQFLSMGYSIEDIEKILKKVGFPSSDKAKETDSKSM